jgi:hypothetical protein
VADAHDDEDRLAYVMREVFDGVPVTRVFHDHDGAWQYLTEAEPIPANAMLAHRSHIHELDPTLVETISLRPGQVAVRRQRDDDWVVMDFEAEDG